MPRGSFPAGRRLRAAESPPPTPEEEEEEEELPQQPAAPESLEAAPAHGRERAGAAEQQARTERTGAWTPPGESRRLGGAGRAAAAGLRSAAGPRAVSRGPGPACGERRGRVGRRGRGVGGGGMLALGRQRKSGRAAALPASPAAPLALPRRGRPEGAEPAPPRCEGGGPRAWALSRRGRGRRGTRAREQPLGHLPFAASLPGWWPGLRGAS